MNNLTPLELINNLRESDCYIRDIYSLGSCYKFHIFLKSIYPEAIPMINKEENHITSLIDGKYYDISGIVLNEEYFKLTKSNIKEAKQWSFAKNYLLQIDECPACDEPLCFDRY